MKVDRQRERDGLTERLAQEWGLTRGGVWTIEQRAICKLRNGILADPVLRQLAAEVCGLTLDELPQISVQEWFRPKKPRRKKKASCA